MKDQWKIYKSGLVAIVGMLILVSCGGGDQYQKSPMDTLIRDMSKEKDFTIILHDMDVDEQMFSSTYKHQYKLITNEKKVKKVTNDSTGVTTDSVFYMPKETITDWQEVSDAEFERHVNDMGMEVAAKTDGKVVKETAPPGYSNYVGNSQYGEWKKDSSGGSSFWHFYGQYAFMRSMVGLYAGPVHYSGYNNYRSNYHGRRPYYGTMVNGNPSYGTLSSSAQKYNPNFYNRASTKSSLKRQVNSRISRSSGSGRGPYGSSSSKTSRSTSRSGFSSSSTSRSSSSGGK